MEKVRTMSIVEVLESALNVGFVAFTYKKLNGEIRKAVGTKNVQLVELIKPQPKKRGNSRMTSDDIMTYFDLGKFGIRSFIKENLISIDYDKLPMESAIYYAIKDEVLGTDCYEPTNELIHFAEQKLGRYAVEKILCEVERFDMCGDFELKCTTTPKTQSTKIDIQSSKDSLVDKLANKVQVETHVDKRAELYKEFSEVLHKIDALREQLTDLEKQETELLLKILSL